MDKKSREQDKWVYKIMKDSIPIAINGSLPLAPASFLALRLLGDMKLGKLNLLFFFVLEPGTTTSGAPGASGAPTSTLGADAEADGSDAEVPPADRAPESEASGSSPGRRPSLAESSGTIPLASGSEALPGRPGTAASSPIVGPPPAGCSVEPTEGTEAPNAGASGMLGMVASGRLALGAPGAFNDGSPGTSAPERSADTSPSPSVYGSTEAPGASGMDTPGAERSGADMPGIEASGGDDPEASGACTPGKEASRPPVLGTAASFEGVAAQKLRSETGCAISGGICGGICNGLCSEDAAQTLLQDRRHSAATTSYLIEVTTTETCTMVG